MCQRLINRNLTYILTGPLGKPEHLELQHKQADGLGDEDHPPHQQGGDGESA